MPLCYILVGLSEIQELPNFIRPSITYTSMHSFVLAIVFLQFITPLYLACIFGYSMQLHFFRQFAGRWRRVDNET